jgi:endoglucanase
MSMRLRRNICPAFAILALCASAKAATPTTAFGIIDDMGAGWNLGNSLDATGSETAWGNPKTTKAMVDAVRQAGFKTMRVPFAGTSTWGRPQPHHRDRMDGPRRGDRELRPFQRMYVIVNIHHNNGWQDPTTATRTRQGLLTKIWRRSPPASRSTTTT